MKKRKRFTFIRRLKLWITEKYLPAYAKEELKTLKDENERLRQDIEVLNAYIAGLERSGRNIYIKNSNGGDAK